MLSLYAHPDRPPLSDHAAAMIGDDLLLFGGLYSDYDEDTVTRGRQPTLLKLLKLLTPLTRGR